MSSRTKNILIGILAALLFLGVMYNWASPDKVDPVVTPAPAIQTSSKPTIESQFKEDYLEGCVIEEEYREYCECTYDYMYDKHGYDGVLEIAVDYLEDGKMTSEMIEAIDECAYLF